MASEGGLGLSLLDGPRRTIIACVIDAAVVGLVVINNGNHNGRPNRMRSSVCVCELHTEHTHRYGKAMKGIREQFSSLFHNSLKSLNFLYCGSYL